MPLLQEIAEVLDAVFGWLGPHWPGVTVKRALAAIDRGAHDPETDRFWACSDVPRDGSGIGFRGRRSQWAQVGWPDTWVELRSVSPLLDPAPDARCPQPKTSGDRESRIMSVSFYRDVYPLVMGALHNDHVIDESEAREIVALSARVVPEDRQAARNQIQALRNTAATAPAWPVLDEFLRRGSGSTPAPPTGARPAPAPAPRPTPSPMPPPMPPSRPGVATRYPPGVVPFGRTRDVPPWIGQLRLPEILDDFGGGNGFNGTGVHLGRGVVLTAGHVVTGALDMNFPRERIFAGEQPYDFHMGLLFWPEGGTYRGNRYPRLSPASRGEWNDFCIVRNELKRGHQAVPGVRPTGSLRAGERVWVVGDQTGDNIRVSTGRFRGLDGANADIESIDVEEGFSGSPVLDDGGRLVGLAVARWSDGNLYIVRTETIARALAEHAPTSEAAGVMAGALEPIRT